MIAIIQDGGHTHVTEVTQFVISRESSLTHTITFCKKDKKYSYNVSKNHYFSFKALDNGSLIFEYDCKNEFNYERV